jgi:hypothetical protein
MRDNYLRFLKLIHPLTKEKYDELSEDHYIEDIIMNLWLNFYSISLRFNQKGKINVQCGN